MLALPNLPAQPKDPKILNEKIDKLKSDIEAQQDQKLRQVSIKSILKIIWKIGNYKKSTVENIISVFLF